MTINNLLRMANDVLQNANIKWAVCGGFALDLFLDKEIRNHSDIDICVFEKDRDVILKYMLQNNWNVYEFRGGGKVRPLDITLSSEVGRNLMCTKGKCDIVKFYPCEVEKLLWYEFFHTGIKKLNYLEFLFNTSNEEYFIFNKEQGIQRELSKAILFNNGIPFLAPEIVLLYKSDRSENIEYHYDFEQTYPHMNNEQKEWFNQNLDVLYPNGHIWKT